MYHISIPPDIKREDIKREDIKQEDIIQQIKKYSIKKIWRSQNKLDSYVANFYATQSEGIPILNKWLCSSYTEKHICRCIPLSAFIYLDFSVYISIIAAGFPPCDYTNIDISYMVGKLFKYSSYNNSSLYLKLKYLSNLYNIKKLIKAFCIIYSDNISEKYIKLIKRIYYKKCSPYLKKYSSGGGLKKSPYFKAI